MNRRVLFVDDEEPLLNGFERILGAEFDLQTAASPHRALELIGGQDPFAVVVTDMRMPRMSGLELIKVARKQSPDTTYIMLTGNLDLHTATSAVNEGHVFRFLNKPCPNDELRRAVQDGWQQYQLLQAEKELLQNTFAGAVGVLTDVLAIVAPTRLSSPEEMERIVVRLAAVIGEQRRWEFKLAARLVLIGYALLERQPNATAGNSGTLTPDAIARAAAIGQRLLERIPRLGSVARMIGAHAEVDGELPPQSALSTEESVATGAVLLRAAVVWNFLANEGLAPAAALPELRRLVPKLPTDLCAALGKLDGPVDNQDQATIPCPVSELRAGMVLAANLTADNGAVLMSAGRRLTATMIERIREALLQGDEICTVLVCQA